MDFIHLLLGLLLIGLGFLVKLVPNLIAGYNTLPEDQKKNVDIEGLSTAMRNGLIAMGCTILAGYYLLQWIGVASLANPLILLVTLTGTLFLVIHVQRFDHNKKKKTKLTYVVLGLTAVFVIGLLTYGLLPSKIHFTPDTVSLSGMYGLDIPVSDIEDVRLVDRLPGIRLRTNGFSFGSVKKGFFDLDELGTTRLLIQAAAPPYLIISHRQGEKTIINFNDKEETGVAYRRLQALIGK